VSCVYVEAMNLASPHSAITSAHCLAGVGYTDTLHQAAKSQQSGDTLGVLMPEATFRRRATEDWIGLSALDYSWCWNLGRGPQAGIKAGLWP
jgi:hypothetical protein